MNSFELLEPVTVAEAVTCLDTDDPGVRVMAGGTALMLLMKARLFQPTRLVSLHRLRASASGVRGSLGEGLRIGALTTLSELERSPLVGQVLPVLRGALSTLSNVRIRNVATLGGHLAHGDPHMDLPPILMTLGARVRVVGRRGERWIEVTDLPTGYYETSVARDELITEVVVPPQPVSSSAAYVKYTALSADDWPAVGVAAWVQNEGGRLTDVRLAVSAATDRPTRMAAAEAVLRGGAVSDRVLAQAADAAAADVDPLSDIRGSAAYKREMVRVHVRRALRLALRLGPPAQS